MYINKKYKYSIQLKLPKNKQRTCYTIKAALFQKTIPLVDGSWKDEKHIIWTRFPNVSLLGNSKCFTTILKDSIKIVLTSERNLKNLTIVEILFPTNREYHKKFKLEVIPNKPKNFKFSKIWNL